MSFDSLVACEWDEFSSWTTCTKTCGGGTQVRQRQVKVPAQFGGEACEGGQAEQRVCNEQGCPSKYFWKKFIFQGMLLRPQILPNFLNLRILNRGLRFERLRRMEPMY